MSNQSGNDYALTTLCPMLAESGGVESPAIIVRRRLGCADTDEKSAMAKVPNTYLCRFFVLDDVVYESQPARSEHLRSKYLVFTADFHGDLDAYLDGMWANAESFIREVWEYCVGFKPHVSDGRSFAEYLKKCQVKTTFAFNGSTDEPLAVQLKSLYLKQEFSKFAYEHQGLPAAELQRAFWAFVARVKPRNLAAPTWRAGASSLDVAVVGE
jgi:hypothetical protein